MSGWENVLYIAFLEHYSLSMSTLCMSTRLKHRVRWHPAGFEAGLDIMERVCTYASCMQVTVDAGWMHAMHDTAQYNICTYVTM